jgi:murein DD-endopeptidase MepM/ murein hydrolase activator NlpD
VKTISYARNVIKAFLFSILMLCGTNVSAAEVWRVPKPFPIGMDTWFGSYYNTTAQHDDKNVVGGWGDIYKTLLRFDLSGLPLVATKAYIYRHTVPMTSGSSTGIRWYKVTTQWQADKVTYKSIPSFVTEYLFSTSYPTANTWYATDVTALYNQWRAAATAKTQNFGVILEPVLTDNYWSSFDSSKKVGYEPRLQVVYTPQSNDGVIKLKWPLGTSYASRVVTHGFGLDWAGGTKCPATGVIKKHNGTDYSAAVGTAVYSPEDGFVKDMKLIKNWANRVVIEHTHPVNGKYTTVLMHVTPVSGLAVNDFVPRGRQVATVADLSPYGNATHFHFGLRIGASDTNAIVSGSGALPQTICTDLNGTTYPAFPENFVNPSSVLFQ